MTGLSPLARGTQLLTASRHTSNRFIPAGAGNTAGQFQFYAARAVYPRWRGEHGYRSDAVCRTFGLSPLARGTLLAVEITPQNFRFIPAGAGNTCSGAIFIRRRAVYPRWRGEHTVHAVIRRVFVGLSPLARGTPGGVPYSDRAVRFIPAGAGNTATTALQPQLVTVYPRWRGEHPVAPVVINAEGGLSPLTRGTPPDERPE